MAGEAIFIGYRRDDTADVAGRIYDAMAQRFGRQRVFKDVDNIGPGVDFGGYIKTVLPRCRVALVLIGPHWLDSRDESGKRRIDDDHDWVRTEIETALATPGLLVVPVLVNGARMPRGEEVPESMRPLLRRNAAIIRRDPDFHDDVERLAAAIRASVNTGIIDLSKIGGKSAGSAPAPTRERGPNRAPLWIGAALALLALGYGAWRFAPALLQGVQQEQVAEEASAPLVAEEVADSGPPAVTDEPRETQQSSAAPPTQAPVRQPTTQSGNIIRDCPDICPQMVRIPGQSYAVGRYEVTFAQWDACVAAGGCNGYSPSDNGWGRGIRPVINVSWNDAQAYVQWLSRHTGQRYRLPRSDEWQVFARAGVSTTYSWGEQGPVCDQQAFNGANFNDCTDDQTRPVGSFRPNPFGLFDVSGNALEWGEDCHGSSCAVRILRGGSWRLYPRYLRSRDRGFGNPADFRDNETGFRVLREL
jgi:formylglycine-generating enzyme required for sulfatase activity